MNQLDHEASFFQSELFSEFQKKISYRGKTWRLFGKNCSVLVVKIKLPLGYSWLWAPYGPSGFDVEVFEKLKKIAEEEKAIFARIEPPVSWDGSVEKKLAKKWKTVKSPKRYTPQDTLLVDLTKSEPQILAEMKQKGRYNINLAAKKGVNCKVINNVGKKHVDDFYKLLTKTADRDRFGIHPEKYYEELLETFGPGGSCLVLAFHEGEAVAGLIEIFNEKTATYYYGASDHRKRPLMAPYLTQWEAIKEAKKRGMKYYDFLGISPNGDKNHHWAGVTEFKKKFGGFEVHYPAAFDIVYKPVLYKLMTLKALLLS